MIHGHPPRHRQEFRSGGEPIDSAASRAYYFVVWRSIVLPMRDFLDITNALADESRLRILLALDGRQLCVCQITELLGLATSTVSKHLSILKQARLIESRKDGRWIYCRLARSEATPNARAALRWVRASLRDDARAADDARRLAAILEQDPEALCRRQARC